MNSYVYLKPYFEAARRILDGTAVKNLEEIRQECNKQFLENNIYYGYDKKLVLTSFIADAENRILLGESPEKIYLFNGEPEGFRKQGRKILEEVIKEYLV